MNKSLMDLEQHENEYMMAELSFLGELFVQLWDPTERSFNITSNILLQSLVLLVL